MNLRRWTGVGAAAALLAGGCAAHPNSNSTAASRPTVVPAAAPSADDNPRWEVRARPPGGGAPTPEQMARQTQAYARTLAPPIGSPAASSTAEEPGAGAAPWSQSQVKFYPVAPTAGPTPPAASTPPAVQANATLPPTAAHPADPRVGLIRGAVQGSPLSDMPREVPPSADFAPPAGPVDLDPLGRRLARRLRENPRDPSAQLDYMLYSMLNTDGSAATDAAQPQLAALGAVPSDDRDLVAAVVDGITNYRAGLRADPNQSSGLQIRPLEVMVDRLRSQSDLTITRLELCRKVDRFGQFDPIVPAVFPYGRPVPLIVYCEVDNFLPQQTATGQWETRLTQQSTLLAADGTTAWTERARSVTDLCRDRRRDFYAFEKVVLPANLPPGSYRLRVTVTEPLANKMADSDVPLTIGGG